MAGPRAGPHAEADARAVVAVGGDAHLAAAGLRTIGVEHRVVEDEAAGREDDAAPGADEARFAEGFEAGAGDRAVLLLDEGAADRIEGLGGARGGDGLAEGGHDLVAGGAGDGGDVAPGRGLREVAEGRDVFGARPDEAVVGRRLAGLAVVEGVLVGNALGDEPVEMLDGAVAVELELGLVVAEADRGAQVFVHLLRRVLEAAGLLEGGATPEIDDAPRHRGGPAAATRALDDEGLRAGFDGGERRRGAGDAEADDEDVDGLVEGGNRAGVEDLGLHGRSGRAGRAGRAAGFGSCRPVAGGANG
jgi:hypothetical protein